MNHALTFPYEPRPRDFAVRLKRRGMPTLGTRQARRHRGRRLLLLLAALGVPALAAPSPWQALGIRNAGQAEFALDPMPFERAGDSFPGSAFYYVATSEVLPGSSPAAGLADFAGGPIAKAMRMDLSGVDRGRALDCLTAAVYYEAASEPDQGQRAVAQVVLNRVAHPSYPNTVCGVVYQGSERSTGCQFSFTCDGALGRRPNPFFWERARNVAAQALAGYVEPSVGLATHYHTIQVHPYWAPSLRLITTIGAHRFYSFMGRAGSAGTFNFSYLGGEPMAVPHARNPAADKLADPVLDPLALQKAYDAGLQSAQGAAAVQVGETGQAPARPGPAPSYSAEVQARGGDRQYSGDRLPGSGVKAEYQNSGQWIGKPGG
ncbi:MAG: cell wall hydrolase [Sphingomonadaceae bacterium]